MPRPGRVRSNDKPLVLLTGMIVGVAVVGVLYWAQKVLIPMALALFFAFLLNPVVVRLQRWKVPRVPAVFLVTVLAAALVLGFGWLLLSQTIGLVGELPSYAANIKRKLETVHEMSQNSVWTRLDTMIHEVNPAPDAVMVPRRQRSTQMTTLTRPPVPVSLQPPEPAWLRWLAGAFSPATELLSQIGLVIVLVIFGLLGREDLRNRFNRLLGHGRLTVTTKAVDDASHRLSRYLLMQLTINAAFGVCVAVGLALLGVRYALLWGILSGTLRYIPYIGSPIAALFPTVLSIAQFDGWLEPGLVAAWMVGLEVLTANVFEPWLLGHSIGVSAVALLVAAAFWAFLWGPVGLVLACPLTVCLVVLGKYVPHLQFLAVLLGDQPALGEEATYYQRLSAHDEDEAVAIVREFVKDHPADLVYDKLMIPALTRGARDLQSGGLEGDDVRFIRQATREILMVVEEARLEKAKRGCAPAERFPRLGDKVPIMGVAARDESDEIGLDMLRQMLADETCELTIAGHDMLSSELLATIEDQAPAAVCIAALAPGGLWRARYLCKRLRRHFPHLHIVVGRWGVTTAEEEFEKALLEDGSNHLQTTLVASRNDLVAWLPALAEKTDQAKVVLQ
jgi:predicted PurR-regulated permease PerM